MEIMPDNTGNIWVAEGTSLHKFDGSGWTVYSTGNKGIRCIFVDLLDTIWIATYFDGMFKFDGINWHSYNESYVYTVNNSGLCSNSVLCFSNPTPGHYWIGTLNGLNYMIDSTQILTTIPENEGNFSIYPNPVSNYLSIKTKSNAIAEIIDLNGINIFSSSFSKDIIIDLQRFSKGLYLMNVLTEEKKAID